MTGLVIPPIPAGLCGHEGCVFLVGHPGPCSWLSAHRTRRSR